MKKTNTKEVASRRIIALIGGPSGIGKTTLAKTLKPTGKTLIISMESGLLCLSGTDIDVWEIESSEDLKEAYQDLCKPKYIAKYDNVFIDSLTEMGDIVLDELKADPKYQPSNMALKMYGAYNDKMASWIKIFRDLSDYSVFMSILTEDVKDGLELVEGFNIAGTKIKNSIKAWFDEVLFYKVYEDEDGKSHRKLVTDIAEAPLAKDRSGKLDPYEVADLSVIVNKILGE